MQKNTEASNSLNAVECEPVPTRVLNHNVSGASYKPKQRYYRKTKLIFLYFFFGGILVGGILSGGFYPGTLLNIQPWANSHLIISESPILFPSTLSFLCCRNNGNISKMIVNVVFVQFRFWITDLHVDLSSTLKQLKCINFLTHKGQFLTQKKIRVSQKSCPSRFHQ